MKIIKTIYLSVFLAATAQAGVIFEYDGQLVAEFSNLRNITNPGLESAAGLSWDTSYNATAPNTVVDNNIPAPATFTGSTNVQYTETANSVTKDVNFAGNVVGDTNDAGFADLSNVGQSTIDRPNMAWLLADILATNFTDVFEVDISLMITLTLTATEDQPGFEAAGGWIQVNGVLFGSELTSGATSFAVMLQVPRTSRAADVVTVSDQFSGTLRFSGDSQFGTGPQPLITLEDLSVFSVDSETNALPSAVPLPLSIFLMLPFLLLVRRKA